MWRHSIGAAVIALLFQQAPPFRASVDLLTVEATVLDANGAPVRDLSPADFTVTIDGRPRKVLFSDLHGDAPPIAAPAALPVPQATSASAPVASDGRIVVFVVDRDSLAPGNERAILDTAGSLLDSLSPRDAVGLLGIPVGAVELTREHGRVRAGLAMMSGTRPRQEMYRDRSISWDEALAYERRDPRVIAEVVERECYNIPQIQGLRNQCPDDLIAQAREMLQNGRTHVQATTTTLESLVDRLAPLRGPKHVILISGGLAFGQELLPLFNRFAGKAAEAGTILYAIHLDQPDSDTSNRKPIASGFGGRSMTQGLTTLTGLTGGAFFSGVGTAAGVFDRIKTEINNFYVLGIESAPDDVVGKLRSIKVEVARSGVSVRAPSQLAPRAALAAAPVDRIRALLNQPTDVHEIEVRAGAYTTRGTEADTLRVLIATEVGANRSRLPVDWGYVVLNEGNVVSTGQQRFEPGTPAPFIAMSSAKLLPGQYRVRVAATDADGRAGVADVPITVGVRVAGEIQMTDLIVGVADAGRLQPRDRIPQGTAMHALIELMSGDAARLEKTRAVIELIPAGASEPIKRFLMSARSGSSSAILLNAAEVDTASLAPGRYTASVVVLVDNAPVGRVTQTFEIQIR